MTAGVGRWRPVWPVFSGDTGVGRWRPVFFGEAGVCASNGQDGGGPTGQAEARPFRSVYKDTDFCYRGRCRSIRTVYDAWSVGCIDSRRPWRSVSVDVPNFLTLAFVLRCSYVVGSTVVNVMPHQLCCACVMYNTIDNGRLLGRQPTSSRWQPGLRGPSEGDPHIHTEQRGGFLQVTGTPVSAVAPVEERHRWQRSTGGEFRNTDCEPL